MTGIGLTAFTGVFALNVGSALSPTLSSEQRTAVLSARTTAKKDQAVKAAAAKAAKAAKAAPKPVIQSSPKAAPVIAPPAPAGHAHPWSLKELYVNTYSNAADQSRIWGGTRPADAAIMARIAAQPQSKWFGDWNSNLEGEVGAYVSEAAAAGKMPVLVAYNIPNRDCGSYSAGGAGSVAAYAAWIQAMVRGIAGRPAVVILEPDALPMLAVCSSAAQQQERLQMIRSALTTLKAPGGTYVYLDAGNPGFQPAPVMASALNQANISQADGFSLNVSNFYTNTELVSYGTNLSALVGNKHYVIDTSRNGNGILSGGAWCNPGGRALGITPTTTANLGALVDAALWIKAPGESDGTCNGGPNAGAWWPEYALGLARRAGW